ncbi:DNA primase, partial [Candidatus Shapirobacteria bacterium RBG_13_44_7]
MENQVEEIKKKLDIVSVISKYLPLKKRGRHFLACCPFHSEKTPSFTVSPELQIFKCFGCGKAGDIYTFVQEFERVTFRDALEILAKDAGITLEKSEQLTAAEYRQKRLLALNEEVARFYHYILTSHPLGKKALDYVLGRGITLPTIKLFHLGYSPQNPQLLVNYLTKKKFTQSELILSGTFGKSTYRPGLYDRFIDRLTFPLSDQRGRVLGFSGRILPGSKPDLAKYVNSPETDLYHKGQVVFGLHLAKDSIRHQKSVIVTEGEFDLIS